MQENKETAIETQTNNLSATALMMQVFDNETYEESGKYLVMFKNNKKDIIEHYKDIKKKAYEAHKSISTQEKRDLDVNTDAEEHVRNQRIKYKEEQDAIAEKERLRLEQEAKEKVEAEQEALMEEAVDAPEEKQEELMQEAENVCSEPVFVPSVVAKKSDDSTWIKDIAVEVTDIRALCGQVASGVVPEKCVTFTGLKAWVRLFDRKDGSVKGLSIKDAPREVVR